MSERYLSVELFWEIGIEVGINSPWRSICSEPYELGYYDMLNKLSTLRFYLFLVVTLNQCLQ